MTKEQQVEEFLERVRLTEEELHDSYTEWEEEVGAYFEEHEFKRDDPNAPETWDARIIDAQLSKVLKDPDLALIEEGKKPPAFITAGLSGLGLVNATRKSMFDAGCQFVIPLAQELKEKE